MYKCWHRELCSTYAKNISWNSPRHIMPSQNLITTAVLLVLFLCIHVRDSAPTCEWLPPLSDAKRMRSGNASVVNVILFSDGTNFDDAVSILFLAKSKRVNLLAIYLQGNGWANPASSFRNIFNMLYMMGD